MSGNYALPDGWASTQDNLGQRYYFNRTTREVRWTRPEIVEVDAMSESSMASVRNPADSVASTHEGLPDGWESTHDNLGQQYYFNRGTRQVQWVMPEATASDAFSESGVPSTPDFVESAVVTDASTTARTVARDGPRGRRRRARQLGPRGRHTVRCRCPFCGHRPGNGGHGCPRRIPGSGAGG